MKLKVKKMIKGGQEDKPTKLEVIQDNPVIAKALVDFAAEKGLSGSGRMKGRGSWWSSFVDWLKANKVISSGTKIAAYVATALGNPAIGTALTAASGAAGPTGAIGKHGGSQERSALFASRPFRILCEQRPAAGADLSAGKSPASGICG